MIFLSKISYQVGKVGYRLGALKPACIAILPNLPHVPHISASHRHTCARAHARIFLYKNHRESKVRLEEGLFIRLLMHLTLPLGTVWYGTQGFHEYY